MSARSVSESDVVFNVVWTGTVFDHLRPFVETQLSHSGARYRWVANGCPPSQVMAMEVDAAARPDRVVEVLDVSSDMVAHGIALDRVRAVRDDGPLFCTIDPDIKANAPFLPEFLPLLAGGAVAVTSGKEVWSDDNVLPEGRTGVGGVHFYDRTGFVFGSPHLAIYDREALDRTCSRWDVGLGSGGPELRDETKAAMEALGHEFLVYDTAKIVNSLLQADGHRIEHRDLPQLLHIGGLSHYLSPSEYITLDDGETAPEWARWDVVSNRYQVARFTALTLKTLREGREPPAIPDGIEDSVARKLTLVRDELADLFARYPHHDTSSATDG